MSELVRITASAGAGKTYKLSLRYIELLANYTQFLKDLLNHDATNIHIQKALRSIVAITFTNKAAAEMKERILKFLKEIAFNTQQGRALVSQLSKPLTPEEAAFWIDAILENYTSFQVRTIDSLLFSILRGLSLELDLASELEVVFDRDRLFSEAFDRLLHLVTLQEGQSLWQGILKTYLEVEERGGFYPERGIKNRLREIYQSAIAEKRVASFTPSYTDIETLREKYKKAYQKLQEATGKRISEAKIDLEKQAPERILRTIQSRFKGEIPPYVVGLFNKFKEAWHQLKEAEIEHCYLRVSGYAEALNKLKELTNEICTEQGVVAGGEDWTSKVKEKLSQDAELIPFVYAVFATCFRHFLFDEFQDTSRAQFEALRPIIEDVVASGGSLFVVGDVKQAIYGWRGGDSSLFFKVPAEFQTKTQKLQTLQYNYRSARELVDFFNKTFSLLEDKNRLKGLISECGIKIDKVAEKTSKEVANTFKDCQQKPAVQNPFPGHVQVYYVETYDREKLKEVIRAELIKIVESEIHFSRNIAILVRTNPDAEEVARWLFQRGYPVVTENSLRLKSSKVVTGLLNLLDYLYTGSEVSLYGFLSSGIWKELHEEGLYTRWTIEKDKLKEETKELAQKASFFSARSPYQALCTLIDALNLEQKLEKELSQHKPFVERLLDVAHLFEVEESPSIGKFLEYAREEGFDSRVGLPDDVDAIQVITIHKAKGLEFDTVIVPFTDWIQVEKSPIVLHQGKLVILSGVTKIDEELGPLREGIFAETLKEHINLFYVAATRAKQRLYLFLTKKKFGEFIPVLPVIKNIIEEANYEIKKLNSN